ncbi:uncharacterized protein LOC135138171 isoform X1 [Zophobas morio]|uniref:uncharacterized protein LOC135138171 isoform X1 n=1 Tax=Zophobas morio TaxID=2755281 RepID=UPI003083251F
MRGIILYYILIIPLQLAIITPTVIQVVSHSMSKESSTQALLSTAIVLVLSVKNTWVKLRALLDVGSQHNFISEKAVKLLGLETKKTDWVINGIGDCQGRSRDACEIIIKSVYGDSPNYEVQCLVLRKITNNLPLISLEKRHLEIPSNLNLADVEFFKTGEIDLLLGVGIFWKIMKMGQIKTTNGSLHFQESSLGWLAGGDVQCHNPLPFSVCHLSLNSIDRQIKRFWEIEEWRANANIPFSEEERKCEQHFMSTYKQNVDGRFILKLPFKASSERLGTSAEVAIKRFAALERKFINDPPLKERYKSFMEEYEQLKHMEPIPLASITDSNCFYLPHHAVVRETRESVKIRVVFDASCKSSSNISLNDILAVGPKIQDDLISILLRFRFHRYVISSDINKMYRQILIAPEDRQFQRIVWREDAHKPLRVFQLNTLTNGTASAPFLAVRCLQQLADENREIYPKVYPVIVHDFYMDDVLTGADTIEEVVKIRDQLIEVLTSGGFELRKWASNNSNILPDDISLNTSDTNGQNNDFISFDKEGESKTLGLYWNCKQDSLRYNINCDYRSHENFTKRKILSIVSKIFDPLNLVGPVSVKAKLIIQKLWELKLGWDETIPSETMTIWLQLLKELPILNSCLTQRSVIDKYPYCLIEIHGFCDASQRAYGASHYVRTIAADGTISCNLLCSKSRVAPLRTITIPRLELCAALLLSRLTNTVIKNLRLSINSVFYWTDSTIVLAWLATSPSTLNTFVANRVSEIQNLSTVDTWQHVNTKDNPADIISRGAYPSELLKCDLWFHGPYWLRESSENWPKPHLQPTEVPGLKGVALISGNNFEVPILTRYSSISKLKRVMAICLRFTHNCRNKHDRRTGSLSLLELTQAFQVILHLVQGIEFPQELINLGTKGQVRSNSKLKTLNPFLDKSGLIRVGGRLRNSNIQFDQKFPIMLPKHHITRLIIKEEHVIQLHSGPTATLSAVRQRFWPLAGKDLVRQVIHNCTICARFKAEQVTPIMGDLPSVRITPARPFLNSGLDYAGPLIIKDGKTRNKKTLKAYIALFVCMSTKAVHLELVSELTTANFLAALKRFVSRRGVASNIYSDNATNFVGAHNELQIMFKQRRVSNDIETFLENKNIKWHFIPARAPHFGGIWEAGIKSAKYHLKRIVGSSVLTFEEVSTVLACIEACLNPRPLCPLRRILTTWTYSHRAIF